MIKLYSKNGNTTFVIEFKSKYSVTITTREGKQPFAEEKKPHVIQQEINDIISYAKEHNGYVEIIVY